MNENALQTMIQFEQAKSRAKSSNKVDLDEEKEKVSTEQEVQRVQQFETHPVTVDDDTECVKQSWDNRDLTDYRRGPPSFKTVSLFLVVLSKMFHLHRKVRRTRWIILAWGLPVVGVT